MDWIPIKPSEDDRAFMDFQEAIRKQITEIYKLDFLDEMEASLPAQVEAQSKELQPWLGAEAKRYRGETFEVKPHFYFVPFRRSVTQAAMLDGKLNMVVHDYRQWREGQIKKDVVSSATALFITGRANVDVRRIFQEANGNGTLTYAQMEELRRRYAEEAA